MRKIRVLSALLAGAFIATSSIALAAAPTQADFDACNQMAESKAGSSSASPQTQSQTDTKSSPTTTTQAAPSSEPAVKAPVENQAGQLPGIVDAAKDDPAYQQAYRDCLKGRGF